MLKIEGDSEIEVEQGQTFDIAVLCTNSYGERSHGKVQFFFMLQSAWVEGYMHYVLLLSLMYCCFPDVYSWCH